MTSNQGVAREKAYRDYEAVAKSGASKADKDTAWARYVAALAGDPSAAQAPKLH